MTAAQERFELNRRHALALLDAPVAVHLHGQAYLDAIAADLGMPIEARLIAVSDETPVTLLLERPDGAWEPIALDDVFELEPR